MRVVRIIIGVLLVLKAVVDAVRMPASLGVVRENAAAVAAHAGAVYSGGFAVGQTIGLVIGILILLVGGILLIVDGWPQRARSTADGAAV